MYLCFYLLVLFLDELLHYQRSAYYSLPLFACFYDEIGHNIDFHLEFIPFIFIRIYTFDI